MGLRTDQTGANPEPKGTQMDIEKTPIDRACDVLRSFQSGKATAAAVGAALRSVSLEELQWVSIGTRLPIAQLKALRGN